MTSPLVPAEREALIDAMQDMLAGWKYIRQMHGDLYGVGWNRAQDKMEKALAAALAERPADSNRNLDGAAEFVQALIMGQPIWPNSWGKDVAAAAFFLTDNGKRDTASPPPPQPVALTDAIRRAEISHSGMTYGDEKHGGVSEYARGWGDCLKVFKRAATPSRSPEALRDRLQQKCSDWGTYWRASDAHGVELTLQQALELLGDALGVEVEIKAADGARETLTACNCRWDGETQVQACTLHEAWKDTLHEYAAELRELRAQVSKPFWHAVVCERSPIINKAIRRADVAEEYAAKCREEGYYDVEVVELFRALRAAPAAEPSDSESNAYMRDHAESQQPAPQEPVAEVYRGGVPGSGSAVVVEKLPAIDKLPFGKTLLYPALTVPPMKRRPSWRALPPDDDERSYNAQGAPQEPDTVHWPVVMRYSGGKAPEGVYGRVWLKLNDDIGREVEYVPAAGKDAALLADGGAE